MLLLQRLRRVIHPAKPRLPKVLNAMQSLLVGQQDVSLDRDRELDWEYEHIHQSVQYARQFAALRRLDPDLAACAVAVQNIGRITTGQTEGHAEEGYDLARRLLGALGCFSNKEVEQLARAVRNHSRKAHVDAPLDELAKDVDIYVRYTQGHDFTAPAELRRLSTLRSQFQQRARV